MFSIKSEPLSIERLTIAIANFPPSLHNTKIVQLSDFHYAKGQLSEPLLNQAIAASNFEKPDLVVLTGDYITDDPSPIYPLAMKLKQLTSRTGIYAILGNHDIYYPQSQPIVTKALTQAGIKVLWNEIAYPFGQEFPLVGLADLWSKDFFPNRIMNQLDPQTPRLILSHNPDTAAMLKQWRVDLQLSGHTHGGQIVLPILGPLPQYISRVRKYTPKVIQPFIPYLKKECDQVLKHWEWAQGLHQVGNNYLYVSRGLGSYFPGRLFCPPEVTVLTLIRA